MIRQRMYFLYVVPQNGKTYYRKTRDEELELLLCRKYGRIFAVSGFSRAAKVITCAMSADGKEYTTVIKDLPLGGFEKGISNEVVPGKIK